jgi:hypothetical protein
MREDTHHGIRSVLAGVLGVSLSTPWSVFSSTDHTN